MATSGERKKEIQLKHRQTEKYHNTRRENAYRRDFGITLQDYNSLLEDQKYVCKICKCPETARTLRKDRHVKYLAVDHCHSTGKIRGLLCQRCNSILGLSKDSITTLEAAINYLKETS